MTSYFIETPLFPHRARSAAIAVIAFGVLAAAASALSIPVLTPWTLSIAWKIALIIGLFVLVMTRELEEDEVIFRLRLELAHWALGLLTLNTVVNIIVSDNQPIEAYKILLVVLSGYYAMFRIRLAALKR